MIEHPSFNQAKVALTVGAIVVTASLLIGLVLLPQLSAVTRIKEQITKNRERIAQTRSEVKSYEEARSNLRKLTGSDEMPEIFPPRQEILPLVEGLEKAVARTGGSHILLMTDFDDQDAAAPNAKPVVRPAVIKELDGVEEIPYQLEYFGDYRQTLNFLLYLENLPYMTFVKKLTLAAESVPEEGPAGGNRNTGAAFTQIQGLLFIRKPL